VGLFGLFGLFEVVWVVPGLIFHDDPHTPHMIAFHPYIIASPVLPTATSFLSPPSPPPPPPPSSSSSDAERRGTWIVEEWNSGKSFQFSFNPEAEDRSRDKGIKSSISRRKGEKGKETLPITDRSLKGSLKEHYRPLIEASKAP
jgi:hypothetical protein